MSYMKNVVSQERWSTNRGFSQEGDYCIRYRLDKIGGGGGGGGSAVQIAVQHVYYNNLLGLGVVEDIIIYILSRSIQMETLIHNTVQQTL